MELSKFKEHEAPILFNLISNHPEQPMNQLLDQQQQLDCQQMDQLEQLITQRLNKQEQLISQRLDELEHVISNQLARRAHLTSQQLDKQEKLISQRLDKQDQLISQRLDELQHVTSNQLARQAHLTSQQLDKQEKLISHRLDKQDQLISQLIEKQEQLISQRMDKQVQRINELDKSLTKTILVQGNELEDSLRTVNNSLKKQVGSTVSVLEDLVSRTKYDLFAMIEKESQLTRDRLEGPLLSRESYTFDFYLEDFQKWVKSGRRFYSQPWHLPQLRSSVRGRVALEQSGEMVVWLVHGRHPREVGLPPAASQKIEVTASICDILNKSLEEIVIGQKEMVLNEDNITGNSDLGCRLGWVNAKGLVEKKYGSKEGYRFGAILIRFTVSVIQGSSEQTKQLSGGTEAGEEHSNQSSAGTQAGEQHSNQSSAGTQSGEEHSKQSSAGLESESGTEE